MDWSNQVIMEFLDMYEKEPIIWNPQHKNNKDRSLVYDAWKRIRNTLSIECSLKELKKKKETLMATYRKLSIRVKESKRKGGGKKNLYEPKWFAYDKMDSFLHSVYTPRIPITTTKTPQNRHDSDEEYFEDETSFNVADQAECLGIGTFDFLENNDLSVTETAAGPSAKKRKNENASHVEKRIHETYHLLKQVAAKPKEAKDETSMFCELLCSKLRALDEDTRDIAMHEINNLMFGLKKQPTMPLHDNNYQQPSYFHVGTATAIKQSQSPEYGTSESSQSYTCQNVTDPVSKVNSE